MNATNTLRKLEHQKDRIRHTLKMIEPDYRLVLSVVSASCKVPVALLESRERTQPLAFYRHVCMYLLTKMGYSSVSVSIAFDRDHGAVLHAVNVVESRKQSEPKTLVEITAIEQKVMIQKEKEDQDAATTA